ncbi:MAG: hypothetical protein AB7T63_13685 [Planctomycetota bacterium]
MRPPSTLPFRGPFGLLLLLALAAAGPSARADEVVEGTDFAYRVPSDYRTAPADALTAVRSLATAFFQAAEPKSPIVPFGRGHAKSAGKQSDAVVIFGAPVSGRDDHGDVELASIDPDSVAGAWAGGLGRQGLQFAPDPIEIHQDVATWVLASASYARPDGSQRRVRVALARRGRNGLLLAVDSAANQETAVAVLWERLVASARVGRDAPEATLLENHPALLPGGAALLGLLVLLLAAHAARRRSRKRAKAWDQPRLSAHGLDRRSLSMDQLRRGEGPSAEATEPAPRKRRRLRAHEEVPDPLAAYLAHGSTAPQAPVPEAPFAATAWAATPEIDADVANRVGVAVGQEADASPPLTEQLDPEMTELARRMDAAAAGSFGATDVDTIPPLGAPPAPAPTDAEATAITSDDALEVPGPAAPEEPRDEDAPPGGPPAPPRRVLSTPSKNGTPGVPRLLRNDAYLEE